MRSFFRKVSSAMGLVGVFWFPKSSMFTVFAILVLGLSVLATMGNYHTATRYNLDSQSPLGENRHSDHFNSGVGEDHLQQSSSVQNTFHPHDTTSLAECDTPIKIDLSLSSQRKLWPGNGTVTNPYRIENLTLDGGGSGTGIHIIGHLNYYLVRNCTISNFYTGLSLRDTIRCQVLNNTFVNNTQKAVNLRNSHNIVLVNNTCFATQYWAGIHLDYYSENNSFVNNHLFGCDFHFRSLAPQAVVENNTVDGEPVSYFQDQRDLDITNQSGQLLLYNCSNSVIHQNSASISLWYPEQVTISDNNCSLHYYGVYVYGRNDVRIQRNNLSNLTTGIETESCDDLLIQNNVITNTDYYAIHVAQAHNITIRHNHCSQILQGSGIRLEVYGSFELINNYVTHAAGNGIVLERGYFSDDYLNVSGNICLNNQFSGIALYVDAPLNLWNNTCNHNNESGILVRVGGRYLANNTCCSNGGSGIDLVSSGNQVLNNNCTGNDIGILAWNLTYRNIIWMNTFEVNRVNAIDDGETNSFQLNYWSDYTGIDGNNDGIGDEPYYIAGEANNQDPLPLMFPPVDTSMLFLVHQRAQFTKMLVVSMLSVIVIVLVVILTFLLVRRRKRVSYMKR